MASPFLRCLSAKIWSHHKISEPIPRSLTKRPKFKLDKMALTMTKPSNNTNSNNSNNRFVLRAVVLMSCAATPTSGSTSEQLTSSRTVN